MAGRSTKRLYSRESLVSVYFLIFVVLIFLLDFNLGRSLCLGLVVTLGFACFHNLKGISQPSKESRASHAGNYYLDLARRNSRFRLSMKGEEYYRQAVEHFFKHDELEKGLEAFSEFFDLYLGVFEPRFQIRICKELCNHGFFELSARALETLIEKWDGVSMDTGTLWKEKAYMRLGKILAEKLECIDYARFIFLQFIKEFPASRFREIVEYQIVALEAKRTQKRLKKAS